MTTSTTGPHGIDLTAPGGVDSLLDFHRGIFGHATMSTAAPETGSTTPPPGETTPPAGSTTTPPGPPSPADVAARLRDQSGGTTPDPAPEDGDIDGLPEWAQKMIRDTRADAAAANGRARDTARAEAAEAARQEVLDKITAALGGESSDAAPTPEVLAGQVSTLTAERDEARTELGSLRSELAVYRRAATHRADADALLDSRAFLTTLSDVDPTDESAVDTKIKDFLTKNPRYLARAAGSSSVDHPGGSGESTDPGANATPGKGRLLAAYANNNTTT